MLNQKYKNVQHVPLMVFGKKIVEQFKYRQTTTNTLKKKMKIIIMIKRKKEGNCNIKRDLHVVRSQKRRRRSSTWEAIGSRRHGPIGFPVLLCFSVS